MAEDHATMAPGSAAVANRLEHADTADGVPSAGTAAAGEQPHAAPAVFGLDATMWVALAMAILLLVAVVKGVPKLIGDVLDKQIVGIRARLDEAEALRDEAEALRDEYVRKIANVESQAAEMVAHAEAEATALIAKAKQDADELVKRRGKIAEDKITTAERAALDEVRARTAEAAAKAAASIIAQKHDAAADKTLVDRTISGLSGLN